MQSEWAETHSRALREYLERGMSYAEIAKALNERFNTAYTRNAALGRARRMGLSGAEQPDRRSGSKRGPGPQTGAARLFKMRARPLARSRPPRGISERAAALKLRCVGVVPRHLSLVELDDGDCRYPYGGEEGEPITFCGHPRREGSSYCVSHFHLTSLPAVAPQRDARKAVLRLVEAA
jgi:GcrA cell cycle regulator